MINRQLTPKLEEIAQQFPVIAILGPRQSGKTTLAKATFNNYTYISLENLDHRSFAQNDPRGFLDTYLSKSGLILDEFQHVPSLLSYIQTLVDTNKKPGQIILTGSQNFLLNQAITQTLAGRIFVFTLLPLSIQELKHAQKLPSVENILFTGMYPRIHAEHLKPEDWYPNYILTYIERDVRDLRHIVDLSVFQTFIKLCAGRTGQLLNLTSLGNDCGISTNTARSWLSLLETSYITFSLQPYHNNFSKRLVKSPKLYFYDTGIVCSLLGIESAQQLATHYLRGGIFESFIISELQKIRFNGGKRPNLYFWRDKLGHEIDCIAETAPNLIPIEIKAGKTITSDYFTELNYWNTLTRSNPANNYLIYAGTEIQKRNVGTVLPWTELDNITL